MDSDEIYQRLKDRNKVYKPSPRTDLVTVKAALPYFSFDSYQSVPRTTVYSEIVAQTVDGLCQQLKEKLNLRPEDATSDRLFVAQESYPPPLPASEDKSLAQALLPGVRHLVILPQLRPQYHKRLQSNMVFMPGAPPSKKNKKKKKKKKVQSPDQVDEEASDGPDEAGLDDPSVDQLDRLSLQNYSNEEPSDIGSSDGLKEQMAELIKSFSMLKAEQQKGKDKVEKLEGTVGKLEETAEDREGTIKVLEGTVERLQGEVVVERAERKKLQGTVGKLQGEVADRKREIKAEREQRKNREQLFEVENSVLKSDVRKSDQALEKARADWTLHFQASRKEHEEVRQDLQFHFDILKLICQRQVLEDARKRIFALCGVDVDAKFNEVSAEQLSNALTTQHGVRLGTNAILVAYGCEGTPSLRNQGNVAAHNFDDEYTKRAIAASGSYSSELTSLREFTHAE